MNSPHHPHHHHHHDVHQQRLLWFFSFCNQRTSGSSSCSSSSSSSSSSAGTTNNRTRNNNKSRQARQQQKQATTNRNKFAIQYQQQLLKQQKQSSNVFGCDLIQHTSLFSQQDSIPNIVKSCARFIEKNGIIFGIYRLSGMRVNIHKLRQEFDKNPKISMIDSEAISNDAHAVACVLKQYFRELPTPLLTFHMYEKFIDLFKQSNNQQQAITTKTTTSLSDQTPNSPIDDKTMKIKHYSPDQVVMEYVDDNTPAANCGIDAKASLDKTTTTSTPITSLPMTTKQPPSSKPTKPTTLTTTAIATSKTNINSISNQAITKRQSQFASSVSDSQLISLSSVVTTTTTDIKYQVKLEDLKQLLLQLPGAHYETLKFLMRHLACIAANGQKTGMDSKNVAIVWAPNLLKPRELELSAGLETLQIIGLQAVITEQLIKHHEFLFHDGKLEEQPNSETKCCKEREASCTENDKLIEGNKQEEEAAFEHNKQEVAETIAPRETNATGSSQSRTEVVDSKHKEPKDKKKDENRENNL